MASITIRVKETDHVTIEQNETAGFTITYPRVENADVDDAICIHCGPLVHIFEESNSLAIMVEM